jgi:endonuclease/exonuclease/phosphatase family metal-dependent hydrolase
MTFNMWNSGDNVENGPQKIANHILAVNPDIAAVEEVNDLNFMVTLLSLLGPQWQGKTNNQSYSDTGIVTRHQLIATNESMTPLWEHGATRARIRLTGPGQNNQIVSFYSLHINAATYGPYVACSTLADDPIYITGAEAGVNTGYEGRIGNIHGVVSFDAFQLDLASAVADQIPLFVLGDMNTPSHLDWPDNADSKAMHCGWTYQWPVTKILGMTGLTDAFRQVHPDNVAVPGVTWSTVTPYMDGWPGMIPEPQDRIDMVFYKTNQWSPVGAETYAGTEPITPKPNYQHNDWPSDHFSVVVDFQYTGK